MAMDASENDASATPQALADLRVVEFTAGMAGPWVGRFMAHCGAQVIKVESHRHPSVVRLYVPPRKPELGTQPELSPWFTDWDAGKHFVALDLSRPAGVELARRLVACADVVVENHSSGVMEKLGLGFEALRLGKPDLIMLSTSGYGDTGPDRSFVTWGPNIEALSGLSRISGFPERECSITQYAYPDALSALHGLVAVMAAIDHRERTGEGQYINLSQLEATVAAIGHVMMEPLATGREPRKLANGSLNAAPHGCYPCRGSDRWCVIAVTDEAAWRAFCGALGAPGWSREPRFATLAGRLAHAADLDARVGAWTRERDAEDVAATLQAVGVAAAVVQNVADQFERDPQLAARNFFEEIPHRKLGTIVATGIPLGLTSTPGRTPWAGGAMGRDNDRVLRGLLGLSEAEIRAYTDSGAIESPEETPQ
jgi:crotonobetainyl-CoA:carnitine CoA-transferase CaiB-like acyl-CoA transferase